MDEDVPTVSVIIPAYNHAHCIGDAIASALAQKEMDFWGGTEIIVVDDASTDDTPQVLAKLQETTPNLKVIRHDVNKGASAARNTGIDAANGDHLAFLDSDDKWHPTKLYRQLYLLHGESMEFYSDKLKELNLPFNEETQEMLYNDEEFSEQIVTLIDKSRNTFCFTYFNNRKAGSEDRVCYKYLLKPTGDGYTRLKSFTDEELARNIVTHRVWLAHGSTLLAHRSAIIRNGYFKEDLGYFEDTEYVMRHILNGGRVTAVRKTLMTYLMPEKGKKYARTTPHYRHVVDTYRCEIAKRFGPEAAWEFLDRQRKHYQRITPAGQVWADAAHELTVLPTSPCENGFTCALRGKPCHPKDRAASEGETPPAAAASTCGL
jgi:glycosyltransferase involved in cell wall biosynthesis